MDCSILFKTLQIGNLPYERISDEEMDPISDGCRLCLDPFAENFTSIDSPELKDQMGKVFCFSIEPKHGYCSGVCQSCSYTISEFYQYSEKVRQNQEILNGKAPICDPTEEDSKVPIEGQFECVKVEVLSDSEPLEKNEETCIPKDEISGGEDVSNSGVDESYEPPPEKLQTKRKGRPKKRKIDDSEADDPTDSKKSSKRNDMTLAKQKRIEEDELFNKHFRMICELCGMATATFTELNRHFRKEHKRREGYVVCCNKKLSKRYVILDHIDFHANPDVFRCEVCGTKYKNKHSLNVHMLNRHSSEDQRPFKCDRCPESFGMKFALSQHMERHMDIKCPQCDKMFASKGSLNTHVETQHGAKDRAMICDTCGQEFLSKQSFDRHVNEHKGIEIRRYQCEICQRWLKGETNFRNHMKWVHTDGSREYQCDICLQKYPHHRALQTHKQVTHAEPKHECEFCGKKFKKALSLKEHRTIHTGEVLYSCEHCGIPNNCMANLYQHIKKQHPVEYAQKKLKALQKNAPS